jgi:hypothetical protein
VSGLVQNTNRFQTAMSQVIGQFRDKANIRALIASWAAETQLLENVFFDLLLLRAISSASGVQLDAIGTRIGQVRLGWTDDIYRLWLGARIIINRSSGTIPQIYSVFSLIAPASAGFNFWIDTTGSAAFTFHLTGGSPTLIQEQQYEAILDEMTAAGVNGYFHYQPQFEFTYDQGPGYDQGVYSGDGA